MGSLFNYYYRVDVEAASVVDGSIVATTYSFLNKFPRDLPTAANFWPILKSIGEFGVAAGATIPTLSVSSVEIDNSVDSFGANRKFSDVLQRASPVNRSIVLYVAQEDITQDSVTAWVQIGQGTISDWQSAMADASPTLTFNINAFKYSDKVLSLEVARTVFGMEGAPASSLGRAVPLLLGQQLEAIPVRISPDGSTAPKYAWGTCFYQYLKNDSSLVTVFSKDHLGDWSQVDMAGHDTTGTPPTGYYTLNTFDSAAFTIETLNKQVVTTGVELRAKGNGLASSGATLAVFLLRYDGQTLNVIDEVATGKVVLANYNALNAASTADFPVRVAWDAPAFLATDLPYAYALGWSCDNYTANDLSLHYNTAFVGEKLIQDSTSNGWRFSPATDSLRAKLQITTFTFTDHVNAFTQNGLTYSSLLITQPSADGGQQNPSFDNFPILLTNLTGLNGYSSGDVQLLPTEIADALSHEWDGSGFATTNSWDSTTLAATYMNQFDGSFRGRAVRATLDAKTTYVQLLTEICRGTACRIGVFSTGQSFIYPWGEPGVVVRDIPAADVNSLSWDQRDIATVVNRAVIKTGRSYLYAPKTFESQEVVGYQYTTDYSAGNYPAVAGMTAESRLLYANKDLDQTEFPIYGYPRGNGIAGYLGDASSYGSIVAEFYLARYAKPLVYCSFVVPYHRHSDLKMFDVVTFSSVDFPSYAGTDAHAREGTVNVSGAVTSVPAAGNGSEMVRAQTYRGQIEGLSLVLAMEHAPAVRLTILVLLNAPYDPT